ncbi:FtsX-like permease family protein [Blautia schinkii]|nr:FtsX-like permease family protein [Blautia schinkii]
MTTNIVWKNARHSARDYIIYFLTLVLSLALMYAFNLLAFSDEIKSMSAEMNMLTVIVIAFSFVVVWVIGWLIHYMTKFMLERRSREFGTYMLLGIPNEKIAGIFVKEMILIGCGALAAAFVFGTFLYHIMSMIIVNMFQASYQIEMLFSWEAFGLTILYAALIYGNVMLRMRRYLKKVEIHELLYANLQSDKGKKTSKRSIGWFVISMLLEVLGCIGVYFASRAGMEANGSGYLFFASIAAVVIGIYGIYTTVTTFIVKTLLFGHEYKYQGNRLFLLRGLTAKLNTIGKTMGTLALLLTLTLTATQLAVLFENFFDEQIAEVQGFEVAISSQAGAEDLEKAHDFIEENYGILFERTYPLYLDSDMSFYDTLDVRGYIEGVTVMAQSDFEVLWDALGYEPVSFSDGGCLVVGIGKAKEQIKAKGITEISIAGKSMNIEQVLTKSFNTGAGFHGTGFVVIVADDVAETLPVYHTCLAIETKKPVSAKDTQVIEDFIFSEREDNGIDVFTTNGAVEASRTSTVVIFSFALFYLALIFVCVAATVLAVQQLSDASKYRYRYQVLSKLGVEEDRISKIIFKQTGIYFLIPILIPVPVSVFLSEEIHRLLMSSMLTVNTLILAILLSLGLFLLIYCIYFAATYLGYKRKIFAE